MARHLAGEGYSTCSEAASAEEPWRASARGPARPRPARHQPAGRHGLDLLRAAPAPRRFAAGGDHERDDRRPQRGSREFGVAGYLPKPFPLETLLATVERLLDAGGQTAHEGSPDPPHRRRVRRRARRATWSCATGCADERRRPPRRSRGARSASSTSLWALLRPEDF